MAERVAAKQLAGLLWKLAESNGREGKAPGTWT